MKIAFTITDIITKQNKSGLVANKITYLQIHVIKLLTRKLFGQTKRVNLFSWKNRSSVVKDCLVILAKISNQIKIKIK